VVGHSSHRANLARRGYGKDLVERIVSAETDVIKLAGQEARGVRYARVVVEEGIVLAIQVANGNGGFWGRWEVLKLKPDDMNGVYRCRNLAIRQVYLGIEVGGS
jgi:hypothetical protein